MKDARLTEQFVDEYEFGCALSDRIRRWRRLVDKSISLLNLAVGEFRVLRVLSEAGPAPMAKLAKEQIISAAAMTSVVDRLEELRLIERVKNRTDRRVISVEITAKGQDQVEKGFRLYKRFIEKATRNMTIDEKSSLIASFDHMIEAAETG